MLYLAEVQIQKGFIGNKGQVKLLACQRSEQNWSSVSEEILELADVGTLKDGALVLVEVSNKKIQRPPQDAARPLIGILQKFSSLQGKVEGQEEEIEQWKQSLTFQAQELNRREMELVAREDELAQLEEEAEKLEQTRQEIEALSGDADRTREEFERKSQELEGAWAHLRGEQQRLEEQKGELSSASVLDEEKAGQMKAALQSLSEAIAPTETLRDALGDMGESLNTQQQLLDGHWQQLEEWKGKMQDGGRAEELKGTIETRWQEWREAQTVLEQAQVDLQTQRRLLQAKEEMLIPLRSSLSQTEALCQQLQQLCEASGQPSVAVDRQALENMAVEELQQKVEELQQDLKRASGFVKDQEEELGYQQDAIDELKQKIEQASEYDRLSLETELTSEQESYDFLNQSLVGSRRNLAEREMVFKIHQSILRQRQGYPAEPGQEGSIDINPALEAAESQRQEQAEQVQRMEDDIAQMQSAIAQAEELVNTQIRDRENQRNEIKQLEEQSAEQLEASVQARGKVSLYEEILQPVQDRVSQFREKAEQMQQSIGGIQDANDRQLQAISSLQQTIAQLTN